MTKPRLSRRAAIRLTSLYCLLLSPLALASALAGQQKEPPPAAAVPAKLTRPIERGSWIVPAPGKESQPLWGIKGGLAVSLWPVSGGPRGLLRIYSPYLGQPSGRLINFIAIEPIVGDHRGLSELEPSKLDHMPGKAMWTHNEREDDPRPRPPWQPASGKFRKAEGTEQLTFFLFVEPFDNGARPVVQVTLRQDRPHEVSLRVFAAKDSVPMRACVLTATMGNYARLRKLWLKDEVVRSTALWREPRLNSWGFTSPRLWGMDRLRSEGDDIIVAATPDEADPAKAAYAPEVARSWHYEGRPGTQYWQAAKQKGLVVRVNGRVNYWRSKAPLPGGIAYENFELEAPFRPGQEFRFGVSPREAEELGFRAGKKRKE